MSAQADDAHRLQDIAGAFYAERTTRDEARSAGERRHWVASDIASLRAIVNKLALTMATAGDQALRGSPSLPLRELHSGQPALPP